MGKWENEKMRKYPRGNNASLFTNPPIYIFPHFLIFTLSRDEPCLIYSFSYLRKAKTNTMLPKYKRILLKLSGESLMGDKSFGMDSSVIAQYALDIKSITDLGVQVAIVIGGGNIYRGMNEA